MTQETEKKSSMTTVEERNEEKFQEILEKAEKSKTGSKTGSKRSKTSGRGKSRSRSKSSKGGAKTPEPDDIPAGAELFDRNLLRLIAGLIPFSIVASYTGDKKYLLNEQEKDLLATQWNAVFEKYLPSIIMEYGVESALIATIALILVQKSGYFDPKKIGKKKEEQKGKDAS